ncbi:MAG: type II toxin-antitoxin system PemK/MazF family toxin [Thermomicrobiales bacterium]|nr:type II toxin-antitoxin system PemK/MazF family toxin [Thermomicrobiales bacterium]
MSEQQLEPRAGEVWLIDCDPQVGRARDSSCLVISTDYFNRLPNELTS